MTFIPETIFGWVQVAIAAACTLYILKSDHPPARNACLVLVFNLLMTRVIDSYDHTNYMLWVVLDVMTMILFISAGSGLSITLAGIFYLTSISDSYALATHATFDSAAAVAEITSELSFIIAAGATHRDKGKLAHNTDNRRSRSLFAVGFTQGRTIIGGFARAYFRFAASGSESYKATGLTNGNGHGG